MELGVTPPYRLSLIMLNDANIGINSKFIKYLLGLKRVPNRFFGILKDRVREFRVRRERDAGLLL